MDPRRAPRRDVDLPHRLSPGRANGAGMPPKVGGIGDEAVEDATGHRWNHWLGELDDRGAAEMAHGEIVAALEDLGVDSGWWRQAIANGYEVERGLREEGETLDAGYQVGVQRTMKVEQGRLWDLLCSPEGRAMWLGETDGFDAEPGATYETADGTTGEVRTVKAGERLRMTWQPAARADPTTLQLTLACPRNDDSKTTLRVHHEKLADGDEREAMREHWRAVLDRIEATATGSE